MTIAKHDMTVLQSYQYPEAWRERGTDHVQALKAETRGFIL